MGGERLHYAECREPTFNISLSSNVVELYDSSGIRYIVPCLASELHANTYGKAKVLIDAGTKLPKLGKGQKYRITQRNITGNDGGDGSDSGDDLVPYPRVEAAFTPEQLVVVLFQQPTDCIPSC